MFPILTKLFAAPGHYSLTLKQGRRSLAYRSCEVYPSASLIKIPIMLTALLQSHQGVLDLSKKFKTPDPVGGCGIRQYFSPQTETTLRDLIICMVTISDNAATNQIIDVIGMESVNGLCKELGLNRTLLQRMMMDTEARRSGRENLTSPRDMESLLQEILRPTRLPPEVAQEGLRILGMQQFREGFGLFVSDALVAHKGGSLEGIEHDVGIIDPYGPSPIIYTYFSAQVPCIGTSQILAAQIGREIWKRWKEGEHASPRRSGHPY